MNSLLSISLSIFLSISLLSVEYIQSYHSDNGIDIELLDTSEENSTEDSKDSEIDLEINILGDNSMPSTHLGCNLEPSYQLYQLVSPYFTDIPIPPPDFS